MLFGLIFCTSNILMSFPKIIKFFKSQINKVLILIELTSITSSAGKSKSIERVDAAQPESYGQTTTTVVIRKIIIKDYS